MGVTFIAKEGTYTAPATLTTKTITENGTYSAVDDSANGYSSVTVNVEGGGGSSDFSTAEVTMIGGDNGFLLSGGIQGLNEGFIFIKSDEYGDLGVTAIGPEAGTTITAKALLFKNLDESVPHDFSATFGIAVGNVASVDGNCELDEENQTVIIWGDCTITGSVEP